MDDLSNVLAGVAYIASGKVYALGMSVYNFAGEPHAQLRCAYRGLDGKLRLRSTTPEGGQNVVGF